MKDYKIDTIDKVVEAEQGGGGEWGKKYRNKFMNKRNLKKNKTKKLKRGGGRVAGFEDKALGKRSKINKIISKIPGGRTIAKFFKKFNIKVLIVIAILLCIYFFGGDHSDTGDGGDTGDPSPSTHHNPTHSLTPDKSGAEGAHGYRLHYRLCEDSNGCMGLNPRDPTGPLISIGAGQPLLEENSWLEDIFGAGCFDEFGSKTYCHFLTDGWLRMPFDNYNGHDPGYAHDLALIVQSTMNEMGKVIENFDKVADAFTDGCGEGKDCGIFDYNYWGAAEKIWDTVGDMDIRHNIKFDPDSPSFWKLLNPFDEDAKWADIHLSQSITAAHHALDINSIPLGTISQLPPSFSADSIPVLSDMTGTPVSPPFSHAPDPLCGLLFLAGPLGWMAAPQCLIATSGGDDNRSVDITETSTATGGPGETPTYTVTSVDGQDAWKAERHVHRLGSSAIFHPFEWLDSLLNPEGHADGGHGWADWIPGLPLTDQFGEQIFAFLKDATMFIIESISNGMDDMFHYILTLGDNFSWDSDALIFAKGAMAVSLAAAAVYQYGMNVDTRDIYVMPQEVIDTLWREYIQVSDRVQEQNMEIKKGLFKKMREAQKRKDLPPERKKEIIDQIKEQINYFSAPAFVSKEELKKNLFGKGIKEKVDRISTFLLIMEPNLKDKERSSKAIMIYRKAIEILYQKKQNGEKITKLNLETNKEEDITLDICYDLVHKYNADDIPAILRYRRNPIEKEIDDFEVIFSDADKVSETFIKCYLSLMTKTHHNIVSKRLFNWLIEYSLGLKDIALQIIASGLVVNNKKACQKLNIELEKDEFLFPFYKTGEVHIFSIGVSTKKVDKLLYRTRQLYNYKYKQESELKDGDVIATDKWGDCVKNEKDYISDVIERFSSKIQDEIQKLYVKKGNDMFVMPEGKEEFVKKKNKEFDKEYEEEQKTIIKYDENKKKIGKIKLEAKEKIKKHIIDGNTKELKSKLLSNKLDTIQKKVGTMNSTLSVGENKQKGGQKKITKRNILKNLKRRKRKIMIGGKIKEWFLEGYDEVINMDRITALREKEELEKEILKVKSKNQLQNLQDKLRGMDKGIKAIDLAEKQSLALLQSTVDIADFGIRKSAGIADKAVLMGAWGLHEAVQIGLDVAKVAADSLLTLIPVVGAGLAMAAKIGLTITSWMVRFQYWSWWFGWKLTTAAFQILYKIGIGTLRNVILPMANWALFKVIRGVYSLPWSGPKDQFVDYDEYLKEEKKAIEANKKFLKERKQSGGKKQTYNKNLNKKKGEKDNAIDIIVCDKGKIIVIWVPSEDGGSIIKYKMDPAELPKNKIKVDPKKVESNPDQVTTTKTKLKGQTGGKNKKKRKKTNRAKGKEKRTRKMKKTLFSSKRKTIKKKKRK